MSATEMQETEVEQTEIPLETSEESVEVELKDNSIEIEETKEETKETASEQEQEQYGKAVQKRINKLTRRVKDTEREREEAVRYAQSMKEEADKVRARLQTLDQNYISEYGSRISAEQAQAEAALKNAVETGDSQAPQQPEQPRQPDPKAEAWASKNDWFGSDYTMTFAAFGIHKKLVEEEGFDPKSDSYYDELDSRIKNEFAHKFKDNNETSNKTAQTVAGVSRGSKKTGRNKVKLTPSQVAIAKKLGVPLEEYAKHVKG